MLETLLSLGQRLEQPAGSATFKMVNHERMAGSVPVWEKATSAKAQTQVRFEQALADEESLQGDTTEMRLGLASEGEPATSGSPEQPFGFGDLFDIINPLHHIPIIGSFYRDMSGDQIRGPGRVIGGALFGGPLGAAGAMINMLVEFDTGRDISGHAVDMAKGNKQKAEKTSQTISSFEQKTQDLKVSELSKALLAYQGKSTMSSHIIENT